MNADLAVVLSPGAEQAGLGWLLSWLGWLAGLAGMKINCFLKQFIGFLSHRRGSGTRAQNRRGWAGWLGWLAGLAYKMPDAACRKIPCPSAAAQRAVGPQPTKHKTLVSSLKRLPKLFQTRFKTGQQATKFASDSN